VLPRQVLRPRLPSPSRTSAGTSPRPACCRVRRTGHPPPGPGPSLAS
jgi:hypothetical protein